MSDSITISKDEEAQAIITEVEGDINDASMAIDDVNYSEALEQIELAQEKINSLHVYLTTKAAE